MSTGRQKAADKLPTLYTGFRHRQRFHGITRYFLKRFHYHPCCNLQESIKEWHVQPAEQDECKHFIP